MTPGVEAEAVGEVCWWDLGIRLSEADRQGDVWFRLPWTELQPRLQVLAQVLFVSLSSVANCFLFSKPFQCCIGMISDKISLIKKKAK